MRFPNQLVRIRAQLEEYVLRYTRGFGEDDAYSMLFNFYQRKANTIITVCNAMNTFPTPAQCSDLNATRERILDSVCRGPWHSTINNCGDAAAVVTPTSVKELFSFFFFSCSSFEFLLLFFVLANKSANNQPNE